MDFGQCRSRPATFVVNSTGDEPDNKPGDGICNTSTGTCTLRAALTETNALFAEPNTIEFNIPGGGVHTISPNSPLPALLGAGSVKIDGYTQPGASPNTLAVGDNAVLLVEIDGTHAGSSAPGLEILRSDPVTVLGLVINRFSQSGILFETDSAHSVRGCFLGTDPAGSKSMGNGAGVGFLIPGGGGGAGSARGFSTEKATSPSMLTIGGITPADRNLISGNANGGIGAGSVDFPVSLKIQGNYIGTDASGQFAIINGGVGVYLAAIQSVVGGGSVFDPTFSQGANVISGNARRTLPRVRGPQRDQRQSDRHRRDRDPGDRKRRLYRTLLSYSRRNDRVFENVISGSGRFGISINDSSFLRIGGNHIGSDLSGIAPLGNNLGGISIVRSSGNVVGDIFSGNLIAFNAGPGVTIGSSANDPSNNNRIEGNSIHDNATARYPRAWHRSRQRRRHSEQRLRHRSRTESRTELSRL